MKPREMYSGQAPAAMGMMGQGLNEVGANIARSIQSGYQQMGQGIAQGINAAANAYSEYKSAKTQNDITKKMLEDPQYAQILGLPDPKKNSDEYEQAKSKMLTNLNDTIKSHGEIGGAQFSKQFLSPIQEYVAIGRQYSQQAKLADINASTARLVGLTGALAPYGLPQKGGGIPNADAFIHPDFRQTTQPSGGAVGSQDEVNAFKAENPTGSAEDFQAWQQERAAIRAAKARMTNPTFDAYLTLPK